MSLYSDRNKIIKLFGNKVISPSMYAYDANSDRVEESEQKFDKSIGEGVKLSRQKGVDKTDETSDEQPETTDMPDLESEESAAQRRKHKGLNFFSSIFLAQLKPGNKSQKHRNKIRQLLYSLYGSINLSKTIYKHLMNAI